MNAIGRVLLADEKDTFSHATATLLRDAGYTCTCVTDARSAMEELGNTPYDLLIADTDLPGNEDLRLLQELPRIAEGVPAILVSGAPSLASAMQALHLPVLAYLRKPCDTNDLLEQVRHAMSYVHSQRAIRHTRQRVQTWLHEVKRIEAATRSLPRDTSSVSVATFFTLALANITGTLVDLQHLMEAVVLREERQNACHLLGCWRPVVLENGIREAITVLEGTKSAFRSNILRDLRQKLARLIQG